MRGPTPNEWNLLKDQFEALVHDESVDADGIEKTLDEKVRRRFAEIINRAADQRSRMGTSGWLPPLREDLQR